MKHVTIKKIEKIRIGYLWIFANDILEKLKDYEPGELVEICDNKNNFLGIGYINPHSLIAVRILTFKKEEINQEFIQNRILHALEFRNQLVKESSYRLIYSESDNLPGLIVDKYGSAISVQIQTAGMEKLQNLILHSLDLLLRPTEIFLKNETRARELEGLEKFNKQIKGNKTEIEFNEGTIKYNVNLLEGQKTGFFLDQRDNRREFANLVKNKNGLDLFCYHGAWGLQLLQTGSHVKFIDSSEKAILSARKNAELNNLHQNAEFIREDVFAFLKNESENQFDFIVFDPPAFIKSKSKFQEGYRAYRDQNAKAMRLLKPGGLMATSSCSHHMYREEFVKMLAEAGAKAGRTVKLLSLRGGAYDHPVYLPMPETEYLKCAFLAVE